MTTASRLYIGPIYPAIRKYSKDVVSVIDVLVTTAYANSSNTVNNVVVSIVYLFGGKLEEGWRRSGSDKKQQSGHQTALVCIYCKRQITAYMTSSTFL